MKASKDDSLLQDNNDNNKDAEDWNAPLTLREKIKLFLTIGNFGICALLFCSGALFHTYPNTPKIWDGLVIVMVALAIACFGILFPIMLATPRLTRGRMKNPFSQNKSDECMEEKLFNHIFPPLSALALFVCGWDGRRMADTTISTTGVMLVGAILLVAGQLIVGLTFRANEYAIVTICHQQDQHLATTGIYRFVRHPMYTGNTLTFWGIPMALGGSIGSFIPMGLLILIFFLRTFHEERFLLDKFGDGYKRYQHETTSKIIPGIF